MHQAVSKVVIFSRSTCLIFIAFITLFQVASYGGNLMFMLQFSAAQDTGEQFRDVDIELIVRELINFEACTHTYFHLQLQTCLKQIDNFIIASLCYP